jgi:hypothetical protein
MSGSTVSSAKTASRTSNDRCDGFPLGQCACALTYWDDAWAGRPSTIDVLLCAVMALAAMSSARPKVRALNKPGFRFPTVSPSFRTLVLVSFLF